MNNAPVPQTYSTNDLSDTSPIEKEVPAYTKTEVILSAAVAVLAFLFIRYTVFNLTGFFTTGIFIALISAAVIYLRKKEFKFSRFNKILTTVLYIFSTVFSITANDFIKSLDTIFLCAAASYLIYSVTASENDVERFLPYALKKSLFSNPFSKFGTQGRIAADSLKGSKIGGNILPVLIGLFITVPLTAIVAALLMSADDGLAKMLSGIAEKIFSDNISVIIAQLMLTIPCSMYIFGMLYSNCFRDDLKVLDRDECTRKLESARFIRNLIVYTAVTPICILYVMFFISQANYFLSAFMNNLPDGYSYADYARQGFFELFAVSVINLGVIAGMSLFSKNSGRNKPTALKFYIVTISIFTLVLIATAVSKMVMYISAYGLTQLRFYTTWFMLLLAVIFVMIIIKQFRFDFRFARHLSVAFTLLFGILCFSRPDSLIAAYNIEMYSAGYLSELDTHQIMQMSDDAVLTALNKGVVSKKTAAERFSHNGNETEIDYYNLSSVILRSKSK